jgi:hypothetical protein
LAAISNGLFTASRTYVGWIQAQLVQVANVTENADVQGATLCVSDSETKIAGVGAERFSDFPAGRDSETAISVILLHLLYLLGSGFSSLELRIRFGPLKNGLRNSLTGSKGRYYNNSSLPPD